MTINEFKRQMNEKDLASDSTKFQVVNFCGHTYKTYSKVDLVARIIDSQLKSIKGNSVMIK